jgi:hypothetical protein
MKMYWKGHGVKVYGDFALAWDWCEALGFSVYTVYNRTTERMWRVTIPDQQMPLAADWKYVYTP